MSTAPGNGKPAGGPPRNRLMGMLSHRLNRVTEQPSLARQFWHVVQMVVMGARRVQIARMAAALAYRTIFGLIPVIVVSISVYGSFAKDADVSRVVENILRFTRLSDIEAKPAMTVERAPDGEQADPPEGTISPAPRSPPVPAPQAEPARLGPPQAEASAEKLDDTIKSLVRRVRRVQFGAISVVGIATLIYAALSMLVEIEKAFNQIYLAPSGRSWTRRVPLYWTLLTLGSLGLVASFGVQERVLAFVSGNTLVQRFGLGPALGPWIGYALTVAISVVLLFVVYMTVPNTRVRPNAAVVGAVFGAVLWEAGKWGFSMYLRYSVGYSKLYGSIAILPLFLMWVYVTWAIVLFGLQIAQALQTYSVAKDEGLTHSVLGMLGLLPAGASAPSRRNPIVDPAAILVVMAGIAQRFAKGECSDHSHIADATGIDERIVNEMLERLAGVGLLHRLASGDQEGTYTLARPPESIPASEVLRIGEDLAGVDRKRAPKLFDELSNARAEAVKGRSVADLIHMDSAKPTPGGPA